jgi:hypothetical protein
MFFNIKSNNRKIKNINIDSVDNVSFYICLLNNQHKNIKEEDIDIIKNYLL